jgi:hypothetical protein
MPLNSIPANASTLIAELGPFFFWETETVLRFQSSYPIE